MKKITAVLLAAAATAALSGCGQAQQKPAETQAAQTTQAAATEAAQTEAAGGDSAAAGSVVWPEKNVQISVPYKAGGGVDTIARMVCAQLEKSTGQSFVITNKPEGNGIIAINELMEQEPDGYNLMILSNRDLFGHIVNKIEGVEYGKDSFTYIATLMEGADSLMTQSEKFASFDDMVAYAKENPGKLTIATANNTGLQTLNTICEKLGIEVSGVAYSSGNDAFADLMGGHVDGAMVALSFYKQGKDNGIAPVLTISTERFAIDDLEVPCISDYDLQEAASPMVRFLMGPADMDEALVQAIKGALDTVYAEDGELVKSIRAQYDSPRYLTGDELQAFVDENFALREEQAAK